MRTPELLIVALASSCCVASAQIIVTPSGSTGAVRPTVSVTSHSSSTGGSTSYHGSSTQNYHGYQNGYSGSSGGYSHGLQPGSLQPASLTGHTGESWHENFGSHEGEHNGFGNNENHFDRGGLWHGDEYRRDGNRWDGDHRDVNRWDDHHDFNRGDEHNRWDEHHDFNRGDEHNRWDEHHDFNRGDEHNRWDDHHDFNRGDEHNRWDRDDRSSLFHHEGWWMSNRSGHDFENRFADRGKEYFGDLARFAERWTGNYDQSHGYTLGWADGKGVHSWSGGNSSGHNSWENAWDHVPTFAWLRERASYFQEHFWDRNWW